MIFLQFVIALTGNYCFFNLLTIALCLLLIDDAVVASLCRGALLRRIRSTATQRRAYNGLSRYAAIAVIIVTLPINAWLIFTAFKPDTEWPRLLAVAYGRVETFRIVNGYGLFRVMTKGRDEIVIEGSADGIDWLPYEFKWKPGDVMRAPGWCAPHQPRLDWQMWFAALGSPRENAWFYNLEICLLEGKTDVTRLFARNAFPEKPPRYIRATFYRYRFATSDEHRKTGAWWKRQELGEYLPTIARAILTRSMIIAGRLRDASSVSNFGDAERGADRNGRNGDASVAGHDVLRRSSRPAQCPRPYFRQYAQAFHLHRACGQGLGGIVALRSDQGADHFSRAVAHR